MTYRNLTLYGDYIFHARHEQRVVTHYLLRICSGVLQNATYVRSMVGFVNVVISFICFHLSDYQVAIFSTQKVCPKPPKVE